jgi:transcriptional regulator with XRE-family HTH domain
MRKPSSWRELLETIISTSSERERIATAIGVRSITLTRWSRGASIPRPQHLRQLLQALPGEYQNQFRELLEREGGLPPLPLEGEVDLSEEIPFTFVNEVLDTRATTPDSLRFWAISRQVLQHAIRHLDPEPVGMAITVVRCMPPCSDGRIHSLRESAALGTPPWRNDLEHQSMFLGAESLAGYVVASGHPAANQNLTAETTYLPIYRGEHEMSAAAFPLLYAGRIAGCLLFSSARPNYFTPPSLLKLIRGYTNLMALAFETDEFYPHSLIALRMMPPLELQQKELAIFRQRVIDLMKASAKTQNPITLVQAEQLAWRQIEETLLHLSPQIALRDSANT